MSLDAQHASVPSITFTGSSESTSGIGHSSSTGTGVPGSGLKPARSLGGYNSSTRTAPSNGPVVGDPNNGSAAKANKSGPHRQGPNGHAHTHTHGHQARSGSGSSGNAEIAQIVANERTLPLALTALTSLEALNGAQMPSTFLPSYYPERNHHLLPSYARGSPREHSQADSRASSSDQGAGSGSGQGAGVGARTGENHLGASGSVSGHNSHDVNNGHRHTNSRSPNPHLLDGIAISEPLVQSPHGSPRLVLDEDLPLSARLDTDHSGRDADRQEGIGGPSRPQPFKPKDWGWAEVPLYGREDPTSMADIKAAGYLGDLYGPNTGPWANGKDVTAEEYAQALSIYEHLLSALPFISPRTSPTEQGLQSLIALAAEGMSIVAPAAPLPGNMSAQPLDRQREGPDDGGGPTTVHPPVNKRGAKESKDSPVCLGCGATETPEWRRGPMGPRTLCNACGLVHMKMMRKKRKQEEAQAAKAQKKGERVDGST